MPRSLNQASKPLAYLQMCRRLSTRPKHPTQRSCMTPSAGWSMRHGPAELLVAAGAGATLRGELRVELLEGDPVSSLEPAFAAGFPATAAQFRIAGIALLE